MPKLKMNPLFKEMYGKIDGLVCRRSPNDEIIVYKAPDMSKVKPSEAQKNQRSTFREANYYSQIAMADPEMRAYYE